MSRRTRQADKRRRKRLLRTLSLLEASNCDPKRRNRKTRKRELMNLAETDLRRNPAFLHADPGYRRLDYEGMTSNADQA